MTRDFTYDGLRGWLLIVIAINHLYGGFVSQITREPFGFVSAAEGFVFLSGFVAYLVYSRLADDPLQLKRKIWLRSFTIYRFHIIAVLITFTLIWFFPIYISQWVKFFNAANWFNNPMQTIGSALLLLENPGYHDILILYLVPMLFLPFAILCIKKEKAYWVAIASFTVWLIAQFATAQQFDAVFKVVFPDIKLNVSYFDPLAWQIYFYMGVLLSYLKFHKGYQFNFNLPVKLFLISSIIILFSLKHWPPNWIEGLLYGHGSASLLRQLNLLLIVYAFMLWMRHYPWLFKLKYPVFLGQHALPVFSFHTIVIYFLLPATQSYTTDKWYWDVLVSLFFISLLAIPAKLDQIYRSKKTAFKFTEPKQVN